MFALGIIGEYLARMHFRMMERPTYTVLSDTFGSYRSLENDLEERVISNTCLTDLTEAVPKNDLNSYEV